CSYLAVAKQVEAPGDTVTVSAPALQINAYCLQAGQLLHQGMAAHPLAIRQSLPRVKFAIGKLLE
ncbi:MAG: hypothetical protein ACI87W_002661, partial [Halieaceae bacterium]